MVMVVMLTVVQVVGSATMVPVVQRTGGREEVEMILVNSDSGEC